MTPESLRLAALAVAALTPWVLASGTRIWTRAALSSAESPRPRGQVPE